MAWSNFIVICFWIITLVVYSVDYIAQKEKPPFIIFVLAIITILILQLQNILGV